MKWLTQKIFNFISRFRNDVYLEKLTTTTDTSVLVVDSNKKICKNTTTLGGDITAVVAGTNLSGGATSGSATITLADASTSVKGAASFSSTDFTVSSGDVRLIDLTVSHIAAATLVTASEGILPANANDTTFPTSSAVNDLVASNNYQYLTWSASAKPTRDGSNNPEWMLPHQSKGIYEEDWNYDSGLIETTTGADTYTFGRQQTVNALVIPRAGTLVGFVGHGRNNHNDEPFKAGLFHAIGSAILEENTTGIDYGSTGATNEFTLRCVADATESEASGGTDGTTGHNFMGPCKLVSNTVNLEVGVGDALMPAIMGHEGNSTDEIFITMTIILKTTPH